MTDEELIARLREIGKFSFGWTADQAADRIEALVKQCEGLAQAAMNNGQALILAEDRIKRLEVAMIQMRDDRTAFRHAVHFRRFITTLLKGADHD